MRLYPPVTKDEAFAFLMSQATALWGAQAAKDMEAQLERLAESMAAVSAVQLPENLEPLFT